MQGYSNYNIVDNNVTIKDSANLDAFSRLRVSNPLILHNAQFTYDLAPIIFEQITTGTGSTITHDTTNRCASMSFSSTAVGGESFMQSYEYMPYQPGRSQLIFVTFNMEGFAADTLKFAGYSDGKNGVEYQVTDIESQFTIYSDSGLGDETVIQKYWNIDRLDGLGPSGLTLDVTQVQILVIDIQALYVGRVRVGFDIGGKIVYAHEFDHANKTLYPYIQTANLPVRCGMTCTGTSTTTMNFICSAVISEGGSEDINVFGYTFETNSSVATGTGGAQLMTLRPKTLFNSFKNRMRVAYIDVEVYNAGNQPIRWDLCVGQAITGGTWADVNTLYSGTEVNTGATLSGSPAIVIDSGWVASSGSTKGLVNTAVISKYPITLDAAGLNRTMGSLTLKVVSLSGTQTVYGGVKFREIR